jgi:hypothetical protein
MIPIYFFVKNYLVSVVNLKKIILFFKKNKNLLINMFVAIATIMIAIIALCQMNENNRLIQDIEKIAASDSVLAKTAVKQIVMIDTLLKDIENMATGIHTFVKVYVTTITPKVSAKFTMYSNIKTIETNPQNGFLFNASDWIKGNSKREESTFFIEIENIGIHNINLIDISIIISAVIENKIYRKEDELIFLEINSYTNEIKDISSEIKKMMKKLRNKCPNNIFSDKMTFCLNIGEIYATILNQKYKITSKIEYKSIMKYME